MQGSTFYVLVNKCFYWANPTISTYERGYAQKFRAVMSIQFPKKRFTAE